MRRDIAAKMASRAPQPWGGTSVDTETHRGWARLICTPTDWCTVRRGDWKRGFRFLVDNGPTISTWNLRFDAEAILKHLPADVLRHLLALESVEHRGWRVEVVPWKMVRVTDPRGIRSELYDIAPFFGGSLDKAARRFLRQRKRHGGVDPKLLNTDPGAWRDLGPVIKYCQRDAHLTDRLTHMLSDIYTTLGGSFDRPFSVAFVAADMLTRDVEIPALAPRAAHAADKAFHGARFECIQRGLAKDAVSYDIKSAYPAQMLSLADAARGRWVEGVRPHKDALYAIVRCRADVDPDDYPILAPLPYRRTASKPTIYPTGTFETRVLLRTYQRFEDILTPLSSISFIPSSTVFYPYRRTISRLIEHREKSDGLLDISAKRGSNAVFGKLLNTNTERSLVPIDAWADHLTTKVIMHDGTPHRVERKQVRGRLWNPLHGGYVTEGCRLAIWDHVSRAPDKIIMIMADGLLTDGPVFGTEKARIAGDMGFKARGRAVSCGSGLYEIRQGRKNLALATRGVTFGDGKVKRAKKGARTWFGALRGVRERTVLFEDVRPVHLGEALSGSTVLRTSDEVRTLGLKDANVFLPFRRRVDVTIDDKRLWPDIAEARLLLKNRYLSRPIQIH